MVNLDDPDYVSLSKAKKIEYMDKKIADADKKLENIDFFIDIVNDYKAKLTAEKAKL